MNRQRYQLLLYEFLVREQLLFPYLQNTGKTLSETCRIHHPVSYLLGAVNWREMDEGTIIKWGRINKKWIREYNKLPPYENG